MTAKTIELSKAEFIERFRPILDADGRFKELALRPFTQRQAIVDAINARAIWTWLDTYSNIPGRRLRLLSGYEPNYGRSFVVTELPVFPGETFLVGGDGGEPV